MWISALLYRKVLKKLRDRNFFFFAVFVLLQAHLSEQHKKECKYIVKIYKIRKKKEKKIVCVGKNRTETTMRVPLPLS